MNLERTSGRSGGRTLTIHATFEEIIGAIGLPEDVSRKTYKVDVQWDLVDADTGREIHVWNYKNGPNYCGEDGTPIAEIKRWSGAGSQELAEELGLEVESMGL